MRRLSASLRCSSRSTRRAAMVSSGTISRCAGRSLLTAACHLAPALFHPSDARCAPQMCVAFAQYRPPPPHHLYRLRGRDRHRARFGLDEERLPPVRLALLMARGCCGAALAASWRPRRRRSTAVFARPLGWRVRAVEAGCGGLFGAGMLLFCDCRIRVLEPKSVHVPVSLYACTVGPRGV